VHNARRGPWLYTVEEAAAILRICRTKAYEMARHYLDTGGREGWPVIRLGKSRRVPAWALWELAGTGRVVALSELVPAAARARRGGSVEQLVLVPGE
jgi:hypothetical protein